MAPRGGELIFENVYNFVMYFVILFVNTITVALAIIALQKALVANINAEQSFIYIAIGLAFNLAAWVIILGALGRFVMPARGSIIGLVLRPLQRWGGAFGLWLAFALAAAGSSLLTVAAVQLQNPVANNDVYQYSLLSGAIGIVTSFFLLFHAVYASRLSTSKKYEY